MFIYSVDPIEKNHKFSYPFCVLLPLTDTERTRRNIVTGEIPCHCHITPRQWEDMWNRRNIKFELYVVKYINSSLLSWHFSCFLFQQSSYVSCCNGTYTLLVEEVVCHSCYVWHMFSQGTQMHHGCTSTPLISDLKFLLTAWSSLPLEWIAIKMFSLSSDGGVLTVWDEVEQEWWAFPSVGSSSTCDPLGKEDQTYRTYLTSH
jgi:hypothetical protein